MKYRFFLSAIIFLSALTLSFSNNPQDSLPTNNPQYQGYRLAITDITFKEVDGLANFKFTLINTGTKDIKKNESVSTEKIVLNIDELTSNIDFKKYTTSFKQSLLDSEINIKAGEIIYGKELNISNNPANTDITDNNEANLKTVEIAKVHENDLSTTSALAKGMNESTMDNSECSDLIIESISIIKKTKSTVILQYKIKNQGKQPASIVGTSKSQDDNLALKFHMSSSEKLTRGAIPIGGTIVKDGKQIPDGKLYPGKTLTEEVKLDIRNMTRFTPIIIIEIDPYLSVQECSKTNNLKHIKVN